MKKSFSILLAVVMLLGTLTYLLFSVSATTEMDFWYTLKDGTATVTGFRGSGGEVVIPETLVGYPVTTIGYRAFYDGEVNATDYMLLKRAVLGTFVIG